MAIDSRNTTKNGITPPLWPRSRPTHWLAQAKGNARLAAVLYYAAEHVWLSYANGREYLAACRIAGVAPDEFGWTVEDTEANRQLMFYDFNPTDPEVRAIIKRFTDAALSQDGVR